MQNQALLFQNSNLKTTIEKFSFEKKTEKIIIEPNEFLKKEIEKN